MDWNHEVVNSLIWLGKAFGITLTVLVIVGGLLIQTTRWGRQFWQLSGQYFLRYDLRSPIWPLMFILLITLFGVRMDVLFSRWYNQMYTSLQKLDFAAFWFAMIVFCILATIHVVRALYITYLQQAFSIHWRQWLNTRLVGDWLDGNAYYKAGFLPDASDNPDQRIQQDITAFATSSLSLLMGIIDAVVSMVEFTIILWGLAGTLRLAGLEIPHGLVYVAYAYVVTATVFAYYIGRPLISLNFISEQVAATYRYALVRLKEYSESIAFFRGNTLERAILDNRFLASIANAWQLLWRNLFLDGYNLIISQIAVVFPLILQAQRFFSKEITLGDLMQTSQAFGQLQGNLSFFRRSFSDFAGYKATLDRLTGFVDSNMDARALPMPSIEARAEQLHIQNLNLQSPLQQPLLNQINLNLTQGQRLLIRGRSGSGKTTLLRALAGLWPYAEGEIARPEGSATLFLSQKPYLPIGTLRTALYYPGEAVEGPDAVKVLEQVQLGHLAGRLDEEADWSRILSLGEQQRLAFGRALLAQPALLFLDEATSAMDEGLEYAMYQLLRERLPQCILVSVGHRSTLRPFHQQELELTGEGGWQLHALQ